MDGGDWRAAEAALKLAFPEYRNNGPKIDVTAQASVQAPTVISVERLIALQERRKKQLEEMQVCDNSCLPPSVGRG